jgi:hypothetical protein
VLQLSLAGASKAQGESQQHSSKLNHLLYPYLQIHIMSSEAKESGKTSNVEIGCVPHASLLGAATAVSVGISHAIEQIRDFNRPVQPQPAEEEAPKKEQASNNGNPMERVASFKKRLDLFIEEKKEDAFCGYTYDCTKIEKSKSPDRPVKDPTYSAKFSPTGSEPVAEGKVEPPPLAEKPKEKASSPPRKSPPRKSPPRKSPPRKSPPRKSPPRKSPPRKSPPRKTPSKEITKSVQSPSPIARMRDKSLEAPGEDPNAPALAPVQKTQEEIKAERQRRWKTKMKIAQQRKKKERIALNGSSPLGRRSTVDGRQIANMIGSQVLQLIDNNCGAGEDVMFSESEDSGSLDEDASASNYGNRRGRSNQPRQRQRKDRQGYESQSSSSPRRSPGSSEKTDNSEWSEEKERSRKADLIHPLEDPSSPSTRIAGNVGTDMDPTRSPLTQNVSGQIGKGETLEIPQLTPSRSAPISELSNVSSRVSENMNPTDRGFVHAFVHDMIHEGFSFFWQKETMTMNITTVALRLKPGHRTLKGTYCGPRLVWKESEFETYGVDLFAIQMLERASPVQLREYPYAIPSRTVYLLMSKDQEFVFEAPTENDAFRFIHGMRWLIARLTFNMVIGNMDVVCELLEIRAATGFGGKGGETSLAKDSRRGIAMDDVTEQLVERATINCFDDTSENSI